MTPAIDVAPKDLKTLNALLKAHLPGIVVWAYGSRVKWTSRPDSDLDMVAFTPPERRAAVSALRTACEESNLPFRVDLFVWDEVPEKFRKNIKAEHVVLQEGRTSDDRCAEETVERNRMNEWRESTWGEEVSLEYGKALRQYSDTSGNVRVFGTNGPIGWTEEPLTPGPGVILGRKGAYRGVHYSSAPFFVIDTAYYLVPKTDLEMRWLYYAAIHYQLGLIDDGSPIPSTTRAAVYPREIVVPPPAEQRAIAGVLGALDDKIEQNRWTAQALEGLALAIFRAWFVDFEPVKWKMRMQRKGAKALGRKGKPIKQSSASSRPGDLAFVPPGATSFPGMPQEVFDALPTRFVDSEIGPVPEGWEVGTLGDVAAQRRDGVQPTDIDASTPYIGLEHMPRNSIALTEWAHAGKVTSGKASFSAGQILFGKLRPYFHKVGIAPIDGVCSTDIVVLTPKEPEWLSLVLGIASSDAFVAHTVACSTGTKMPRTNWSDMASYQTVVPPKATVASLTDAICPMLHLLSTCVFESRKLAEMRDYLLPRLLSGAVRVDVGRE